MNVVINCKDGVQLEVIARQPVKGHPKRSQAVTLDEATAKRLSTAMAKAYANAKT